MKSSSRRILFIKTKRARKEMWLGDGRETEMYLREREDVGDENASAEKWKMETFGRRRTRFQIG